jgi:putative transcription antitermination factor YqgF
MNYLGLDYGTKHIGVAIATGPLAEPLTTLSTDKSIQLIKALVDKHDIKGLVIGVSDEASHPTVSELSKQLSFLNLPVYLIDETLSSHDARVALMHTTQTRRKDLEHAASAALILQSWLDSHPA